MNAGLDVSFHLVAVRGADERAHLDSGAEAVAELDAGDLLDHRLDELLVNGSLDEQARACGAHLALVGEGGEQRAVHRGLEVGVGEHDVRILAAQLKRDFLEVAGGRDRDLAAGQRAAGEGDLIDARAFGQLRARARAGAGHDVDHACREAGLVGETRENERCQRRQLGGLEDHGAACGERGGQLPCRHQEGIVPGDDLSANADWLAQDETQRVRRHRHRLAVDFGR